MQSEELKYGKENRTYYYVYRVPYRSSCEKVSKFGKVYIEQTGKWTDAIHVSSSEYFTFLNKHVYHVTWKLQDCGIQFCICDS